MTVSISSFQLLVLLVLACSLHKTEAEITYTIKHTVNITQYVGRWYQMWASKSVIAGFELGGNCVTADYEKTNRTGTIKVTNTVRPLSWLRGVGCTGCTGIKTYGWANQSPYSEQGRFYVDLGRPIPGISPQPGFYDTQYESPGNYWIIGLGPVTNDKYQWSIVMNDVGDQLYILARNIGLFEEKYQSEVVQMTIDMGFTSFNNKARKTNQDNCHYGDENN